MGTMTNYTDQFGETFQLHLLAVMARTPGAILRYRSALDDRYFPSKINAMVAKALFEHVDTNKVLPTISTLVEAVRAENNDKAAMVHVETMIGKLFDDDISDFEAVLNRAVEFGKLSALCNAVVESADHVEKGNQNKVRDTIAKALLVGNDLLSLGTNYRATLPERAANAIDDDAVGEVIPTHIPHLDYLLSGGLGRGELGIILAPPKKGKTTMLVNIGFGALIDPRGLNVQHYSCEIRERKVARRYDARLMGPWLRRRATNPAEYRVEMERRGANLLRGYLNIKEYPTRKATVSMLRSHLSVQTAEGSPPDLVLVDYADILKADRRLGEMRHEQAAIYEDLRELAGEFNCAIWTASQTSKGALEKTTPSIADFAESFEKAAIGDAIIAFAQTNDEKVQGRCRLFAAALRNSEDGSTIDCTIQRDRCRIQSVALFDAGNERIDIGDVDDSSEEAREVAAAKKAADLKERLMVTTGMSKGPTKKTSHLGGPKAPSSAPASLTPPRRAPARRWMVPPRN